MFLPEVAWKANELTEAEVLAWPSEPRTIQVASGSDFRLRRANSSQHQLTWNLDG